MYIFATFYLKEIKMNLDFQIFDLRPKNWFSGLFAVARDAPIVIRQKIEMEIEARSVGVEIKNSQDSVWTISGKVVPKTILFLSLRFLYITYISNQV